MNKFALLTSASALAVLLGVVGALLWFLHAWANGKGMNWARITGTVLGVLNILFTLIGLSSGGWIFSFITCLAGACILLFLVKLVTGRGRTRV